MACMGSSAAGSATAIGTVVELAALGNIKFRPANLRRVVSTTPPKKKENPDAVKNEKVAHDEATLKDLMGGPHHIHELG